MNQQRVVCAACRLIPDGYVVTGARHWDAGMRRVALTMKINTQAYAKGYRAYLSGIFRTSNPYDVHNQHEAWEDWARGWNCAEDDELNS